MGTGSGGGDGPGMTLGPAESGSAGSGQTKWEVHSDVRIVASAAHSEYVQALVESLMLAGSRTDSHRQRCLTMG